MKHLVDNIKESVFDPVKLYPDILSPEELKYRFKRIIQSTFGTVEDIITHDTKHYQKDPEEIARLLKQDIVVDKILYDNGFSRRDKSKLDMGDIIYNDMYLLKTKVNAKGYCVVFDPYITDRHSWCFLVTKAVSAVGRTLRAIEWVEPKKAEKENQCYGSSEKEIVEKTIYEDPTEAWKYIEKKYGRL